MLAQLFENKCIEIASNELLLAPINDEDYELYRRVFNCKRTTKFIRKELSEKQISHNFKIIRSDSNSACFSIIILKSNIKVGFIGANLLKEKQCTIEVGVMLLSGIAPRGIAHDSTKLLLNFMFQHTRITSAKFLTYKDNKAAFRVWRTLGIVDEDVDSQDDLRVGLIEKSNWLHLRR